MFSVVKYDFVKGDRQVVAKEKNETDAFEYLMALIEEEVYFAAMFYYNMLAYDLHSIKYIEKETRQFTFENYNIEEE